MPKVSVIVPAYNSEQFIRDTLNSLLRQTLKDIEVIIVNDGSTDSTQSIIDEYVERYPIFKSFTQENAGVSAARNNGLMKATGKYVVFLDADDYYSDSSLEAFYYTAEKNKADLVLGRLKTFGDGTVGKYNAFADKLAAMDSVDTFDITLLWSFLVGNKCYNREKLIESGVRFPQYRYSEEGAFFMSFVYTGAKICGTMDSCMYYRRHTEKQGLSVSQTVSAELAKSFSQSLEMIYRGAEKALENADESVDKKEYMQEVIYKTAYILIMQFYRLMWHGDDECAEYCAEEFKRLKGLMTPERFAVFMRTDADLHLDRIIGSKKQAAENPNVSVIVKNTGKDMTELFDSLYAQISPLFEVIVPQSMVDGGQIPERYLSMENLVVLPDKGFASNARRRAKAKRRIVFRRSERLDVRTFRMIYRVRIPEFIKTLFFPFMTRGINYMLVKRFVK